MIKLTEEGFPAEIVEIVQEGTRQTYLDKGYLDLPVPPNWNHYWTGTEWVAKQKHALPDPIELARREVLAQRANKLRVTDWTQLPDVPEATQAVWKPYRQALRDITEQEGFPMTVIWPSIP